jgi:hypothetical protein
MHVWRGRICRVLTVLVFAHGAWLCWRNFGFQLARLRWALHQAPAMPYPGCPTSFCDFAVFWAAGRLSGHPALIYNAPDFFTAAARIVAQGVPPGALMYPPSMLPLLFVLSRLPLAAAYYVFMAASLTAAIILLRRARIPWFCIIAGLLSPAALWCMYLGQFGILCAAILFAGLAALESAPVRGGALLSLLCVKPQYAMLAPVVILARRSRGAMLGALTAGLALVAVSGFWFGWVAWPAFLGGGGQTIRALLQAPFASSPGRAGVSVFWMARSLGAADGAAYALQAISAGVAALCAWQLWRRDDVPRDARLAMTTCLALLPSPYGYTDDMVGYSVACLLLMRRDAPLANLLLALLWHAPGYAGQFETKFGFVPTPLCIAAVLIIGWWQARRRNIMPASRVRGGRRASPVLSVAPGPFHRFR